VKYKEYKEINYASIANDVLKFWKDQDVFQKSIDEKEGNPTFTFYEGPPSANGTPGIHHVMARTVKDIFCRYKTLKGFQVKRKGGWDTHGLPVELQVEKELGITKEDIGKVLPDGTIKITVAEYNQKCREAVMKFKDQWDDLTVKMGYWVDLDNPYITFENDYIESVWWLINQFYEKGYLYKGYTIQPYSPAAGTGLSSHELNQPGTYKDVRDTSIVAQFKVERNAKSESFFADLDTDLFIIAWTTTPWTLPANNSLVVGKNIEYLKVRTFNPYTFLPVTVILAKDRLSSYFNPKTAEIAIESYNAGDKLIPYKVLGSFKGSTLEGVDYEQLLPYIKLEKPAFTVIIGDFVTTEDGTGVVHAAQTFGADDYKVSMQYGIPGVFVKDADGMQAPIVDKTGKFVSEITDFAHKYVKEEYYSDAVRAEPDFKPTDVLIAIKLKEDNKAFKVEKYEHSYPHCWRTDKPILYYPMESWFIKTSAARERLSELNKTINWKPESTGTGRFGNWLDNLVDWNLSRSRYWGTPLPIWRTEDKKETICIGSIADLKYRVQKSVDAGLMKAELEADFDLHRPYVDDIILVSESGKPMYREPDLIDVWFDSGAMPYAQLHYPFENKDVFEKSYPADFIAEGVDQTRGWFFTLHTIAGILFDSVAYKNVIANGLVLDKNGQKMSKRLGNAVDPFATIDQYGPDATRWYMIANANPWDNLKFDISGVAEVQRRFFGTLYNTYNFFALYANLDGFEYDEKANLPRTESDKWVISKLHSLIQQVDDAYADYEPTKAARAIQNFVVDDLSNWYVRLNRKRFWKGEYNDDKKAAYSTLYECILTVAKLAAPVAPFYAEQLFQDLAVSHKAAGSISVHLAQFPKCESNLVDKDLEQKMELAQTISSLVHSLRKKERIKVRQPLTKILIPVLSEEIRLKIAAVSDLIASEVNVKSIEYIDDTSSILVKKIKPNFKKLGKEHGANMKPIAAKINEFGAAEIAIIEKQGEINIMVDGSSVVLTKEDVEITSDDIPGWIVASENGISVALDINITDELRQEGIARDLVNRIQNLRKDMGLEIQDKIKLMIVEEDAQVKLAVDTFAEYITSETQASELTWHSKLEDSTLLEIDDVKVELKIYK
jgi:isoleucyl-tRNA synthetase